MSAATFHDLVRAMLDRPDMDDAEASYILWEYTPFPLLSGAMALAPHLARVRAALELREAASNPDARLSGHSGVSIKWLRNRADSLDGGGA